MIRPLAVLSAGLLCACSPAAELQVAAPAGDGMVIQRRASVPIRGSAAPGAEVRVTFAGRTDAATAGGDGGWRVDLPPREAGGPFAMTIEAAGERLEVRDVMVGDVWVCSGQSNMEWVVADSLHAEEEMAAARDRAIRHFKVPRSWAVSPETTLAGGAWAAADPEHVGAFSAAGYFFARALRRSVDVPVGLINATWGGSRIEPWMSAEALGLDDDGLRAVLKREQAHGREVLERIAARAGGLPDRDPGLVDGRAVWADPALDDSGWEEIEVPAQWEAAGWEGMDGVAWYRTSFELSAAEAAAGGRLALGTIDDSDITWVNGQRVGATELAWNRPRLYEVPASALAAGRNVVAVRVEDTGGGGGIYGDPELLWVEAGGRRQPLAAVWRFRVGAVTVNLDDHKREVPTLLYNKMVHPLLGFPVKGVLWYQGESNAWPGDAFVYRDLFTAMIRDWRRGWGDPDLPFLFVQLASFLPPPDEPQESDWAVLRESQSAALALPATAQVVLIDAGDAADVHPRDKKVVGERLALAARKVAYGEDVVHSGPVYRAVEVRSSRMVVFFDHAGGGLVAKRSPEGRFEGFAIAGDDRRFVWAEAAIEGDGVAVWSDDVPAPVAIRYAWADNPGGANLYNREGLPASPFRTDDWPVDTTATAAPEP